MKVTGLKGRDAFNEFGRYMAIHPFHLLIFVFGWFLVLTETVTVQFQSLTLQENLILLPVQWTTYVVLFYFFFGRFSYWCISRNIPWAYLTSIFYFGFLQFMRVIHIYVEPEIVIPNLLFFTFRQTLSYLPFSLLASAYFGVIARKRLIDAPDQFPCWRPIKPLNVELYRFLPKELQCDLRRVEAQQQYVNIVTQNGSLMVRMRFKQAIAMIPDRLGLQVHRSLWIAKDQIDKITYVDGNPRILAIDGETYPISRSKVKSVKDALVDDGMENAFI